MKRRAFLQWLGIGAVAASVPAPAAAPIDPPPRAAALHYSANTIPGYAFCTSIGAYFPDEPRSHVMDAAAYVTAGGALVRVAESPEEHQFVGNVYNNPSHYGLEVVDSFEFDDGSSHGFDTRVVWRHLESGVLYTARDSGCSCPAPFEDYTSIEYLDRVDLDDLRAEMRSAVISGGVRDEIGSFLKTVEDALAA